MAGADACTSADCAIIAVRSTSRSATPSRSRAVRRH